MCCDAALKVSDGQDVAQLEQGLHMVTPGADSSALSTPCRLLAPALVSGKAGLHRLVL